MITVSNSLYISAGTFIYKTDKYLNMTNKYYNASACYLGLYFNSSNNTIYVAEYSYFKIYVFDLNLNLVDSVSTSTYQPYSLQGYKNYMYVGIASGELIVIENKVIIKK